MATIRFFALLVGGFAIAACGAAASDNAGVTNPDGNHQGGTPGGTTGGGTNTVTVGTSSFSPADVQVTAGTTVTWAWDSCTGDSYYGQTCVAHDVVFDDGSGLTSGVQSQGSFARTFNTAGTFKYHCSIHGAAMAGQVVVQ